MRPTADENYNHIDNALYDQQGDIWWDENECLHLLKSSVNPARVGYFRRLLHQALKLNPQGAAALDVGCGGGDRTAVVDLGPSPSESAVEASRCDTKPPCRLQISITRSPSPYQPGTSKRCHRVAW